MQYDTDYAKRTYLEVRFARGDISKAGWAPWTEKQLPPLVGDSHVNLQAALGGELAQAVRTRVVVKLVDP